MIYFNDFVIFNLDYNTFLYISSISHRELLWISKSVYLNIKIWIWQSQGILVYWKVPKVDSKNPLFKFQLFLAAKIHDHGILSELFKNSDRDSGLKRLKPWWSHLKFPGDWKLKTHFKYTKKLTRKIWIILNSKISLYKRVEFAKKCSCPSIYLYFTLQ